jgi:hypothetical protein
MNSPATDIYEVVRRSDDPVDVGIEMVILVVLDLKW